MGGSPGGGWGRGTGRVSAANRGIFWGGAQYFSSGPKPCKPIPPKFRGCHVIP